MWVTSTRASNNFIRIMQYHRIRTVRATHIMLDRRTTMMAFTERADIHTAMTCCH